MQHRDPTLLRERFYFLRGVGEQEKFSDLEATLKDYELRLAGLDGSLEGIRRKVDRMEGIRQDLLGRLDNVNKKMSAQRATNKGVDDSLKQLKSKLDNHDKEIFNSFSTELKSLRIRVQQLTYRSRHDATFEQRLHALEANSNLEVVVTGERENESTHERVASLEMRVQDWVGKQANFKDILKSVSDDLDALRKERDDRTERDSHVEHELESLKSQLMARRVSAQERTAWSVEVKPGRAPVREQVSKATSQESVYTFKRLNELEREHDRSRGKWVPHGEGFR